MLKDECILVDEQDRITGHANKYQSHRCAGTRASCSPKTKRACPGLPAECLTATTHVLQSAAAAAVAAGPCQCLPHPHIGLPWGAVHELWLQV